MTLRALLRVLDLVRDDDGARAEVAALTPALGRVVDGEVPPARVDDRSEREKKENLVLPGAGASPCWPAPVMPAPLGNPHLASMRL